MRCVVQELSLYIVMSRWRMLACHRRHAWHTADNSTLVLMPSTAQMERFVRKLAYLMEGDLVGAVSVSLSKGVVVSGC